MSKHVMLESLEPYVFVTKLAGFEYSEYIQPNATRKLLSETDIPMVQGKNIRNGIFIEKYDWYISKDIADSLPRSILNKKCILIPYVGSNLGELGIFPNKYRCHLASNIAKMELVDNNKYDLEYLMYYLQSPVGQGYLFQNKQGSSQPNITMESIRNSKIIVKDLIEQKKISKTLSLITKKIENNNAINNNLEQQAMQIYDFWFTQFNFPNKNGEPYAQNNGTMVWNETVKRNIPINWDIISISDIVNVLSGFAFSSDNYVEQGKYPLYTIKNVQDSGIVANVDNYINVLPSNMPEYCLLKVGDILTSLTGNVGRIGVVFENNALLNQRVAKLQPKDTNLNSFVIYTMKSKLIRKKIETIAIGSSQANISPLNIASLKIPFNKEIALEFSLNTREITDKYISNLKENASLIKLRDFLLPLLMNGQATIDE